MSPHLDLPDRSVRILVLDSHAASRIGLGVVLRRQRWVDRCLLTSNRDEAVALTRRHKPDGAIVDISNVGPFVASHLAPLRAAHSGMRILVSSRCRLAVNPSPATVGAAGLLSPEFTVEQLISALTAALVGDEMDWLGEPNQVDGLSEREREVLTLLSTGATNREIAAVMHVGAETVKKHAGALYRKLGVRNRTEAAQRAGEVLRG
jgi:DNA-binding NarL/FixJ family response regulator